MKMLGILLYCSLFISSCADATKSYTKGKFDKPHKILINLAADERSWREDWRLAFEERGYEVVFQDEVLTSNKTLKTEEMDIEKQNVIEDANITYEFRIAYTSAWDFIWYVQHVSLSVRDLKTGKVVGSYRDDNWWAHPSVSTVVDNIDTKFLSTLWAN